MMPDSFDINTPTQNSVEMWGLKIISHDVFSPPKRERRQQVPFRHGSYDMGQKYYGDRELLVECQLTRQMKKADFREIVYVLSQRNRLYFWDEPDKYYRGELHESVDVDVFPREAGRNFTLPFLCEPFAHGPQQNMAISRGTNPVEYRGTAESPTLIIIRNPNAFPVTGVVITGVRQIRA